MEENLEHSEWMKGIKETGFTTPSNYFEELNDTIRIKMATERLRTLVSQDGYKVPSNYFEQLQSDILAKTIGQNKVAKQSKMIRLWRSNMLKYASAACFIIIAGLGVYFNSNEYTVTQSNSYNNDAAAEQVLFDIDEEVIIEHIEANYKDQKQPTATETALENYILNNYTQNDLTTNL